LKTTWQRVVFFQKQGKHSQKKKNNSEDKFVFLWPIFLKSKEQIKTLK